MKSFFKQANTKRKRKKKKTNKHTDTILKELIQNIKT